MPEVRERTVRFGDRERGSGPYKRAENNGVLICTKTPYLYDVAYLGNHDGHKVLLYRDSGEWRGGCDCLGWHYNGRQTGRPCAHLWAVKRACETVEDFTLASAEQALTSNLTECPTCGSTALDRREPKAQDPRTTGTTQCGRLQTDGTKDRSPRRWHATPVVGGVGSVPVLSRPSRVGFRSLRRGNPHPHLSRGYGGSITLYRTRETRGRKSPAVRRPTPVSIAFHAGAGLCHTPLDLKRRCFA